MPSRIDRITKTIKHRVVYQDFTINFDLNPVTGQLLLVENAQAVIQSIRNLVLIYPTEIYYHPTIGSTVSRGLFEFVDDFSITQIKDTILQSITANEPRAQNVQVVVSAVAQQNYVNVDITFSLTAIPNQSFSVPKIPVRVR